MSKTNAGDPEKFRAETDSTLRHAKATAGALARMLESGTGLNVDCSGVEQADITFVQTLVAAVLAGLTEAGIQHECTSGHRRQRLPPRGIEAAARGDDADGEVVLRLAAFQPHPSGIFGANEMGTGQGMGRQPGLEPVGPQRLQPHVPAQQGIEPGLRLGDIAADEVMGLRAG